MNMGEWGGLLGSQEWLNSEGIMYISRQVEKIKSRVVQYVNFGEQNATGSSNQSSHVLPFDHLFLEKTYQN